MTNLETGIVDDKIRQSAWTSKWLVRKSNKKVEEMRDEKITITMYKRTCQTINKKEKK